MKTFMFPGQGSQKKGMGGELFDSFSHYTEKADAILGYSIKELILENPREELGLTQFTQPALYVVNALSYYQALETGDKPDYLMGHSLGEFNALLAAECFSFESGLKLVKKRGELMSKVSGGGMAAIVNASKDEIEKILADNGLDQIDLANFNTGSQIVISGMQDQIEQAQQHFQQGMMQFHLLKTSGAFHSRHMAPSQKSFANYLRKFKLAPPKIPVIANVTGKPYTDETVLKNLAAQIASSVLWTDSVNTLLDIASKEQTEMEFVEIGHGKVLTGMWRKIKRELAQAAKQNDQADQKAPEPAAPVVDNVDKAPAVAAATNNDDKPQAFVDAEQLVKDWNSKNDIGTKVKSSKGEYDDLQTRTKAIVLFGHRAAVYMKDYNGYFDLTELTAV